MNRILGTIAAGALATAAILGPAAAGADGGDSGQDNAYKVNRLVSDLPGLDVQDMNLRNAWGVAFSPAASPFWIADNASGCSTLYDGTGAKVALEVKIPLPDNSVPSTACQPASMQTNPPPQTPAAPTGIVWNPTTSPTTGFLVPGTNIPASFIFDTEDGTLSAWAGTIADPTRAVIAVDNSGSGAVYKALATGVNAHGVFLFATNFNAGTIDVFAPNGSTGFRPATNQEIDGDFTDPNLPPRFAPFGIQNINGDLFVTYAKQNAQKHDDVAGPGNGFVDVFDTDGHLLRRFASRGTLNSPWGVVRASFAFGQFSGDILIGNFGDGRINVFDSDGNFLAQLNRRNGKPLVIDGLWTLTLGGGKNSSSDTLYFTAGPNSETDGLFGTITPVKQRHMAAGN
ncbi:MAG TPA: TIGR03118 family protein [Stellaceae bacterium]|nr:TIGR03118 family protein [Stellaceae bacterium]